MKPVQLLVFHWLGLFAQVTLVPDDRPTISHYRITEKQGKIIPMRIELKSARQIIQNVSVCLSSD